MTSLSHREAKLLEFLRAHVRAHGFAPSFNEICAHLSLSSKSGAARAINSLVEKGLVRRIPFRARALAALDGHPRDCGCRICVAAREDDARRYHLMLIDAIKAKPPALFSTVRLSGVRLLSKAKRAQVLAQVQPAAPKSRAAFPSEAR